ncbi:MAG: hypothetical protein QG671_1287 [Actinomycetota bacterium]|nr:hypothetical protein [Actinomycetota bacterium]
MRILRRASALALMTIGTVTSSTLVVPSAMAATPEESSLTANRNSRVTCSTAKAQYRIRLAYPNPYARPGQDPYDGGILTVLIPRIRGAKQQGTVAVRYVISGQRIIRTESNARGRYVSVRYGARQGMKATVTARVAGGRYVSCGTVKVPLVAKPNALRSVAENAYPNYWR